MKQPTIAPMFACMYPGLCDIARQHGYCLAIHGSVVTDLDLVAIPWTKEAVEHNILVDALFKHLNALDYKGLLTRDCTWLNEQQINQLVNNIIIEDKPHGRVAYNLYLYFGVKIDLSIMPLLK